MIIDLPLYQAYRSRLVAYIERKCFVASLANTDIVFYVIYKNTLVELACRYFYSDDVDYDEHRGDVGDSYMLNYDLLKACSLPIASKDGEELDIDIEFDSLEDAIDNISYVFVDRETLLWYTSYVGEFYVAGIVYNLADAIEAGWQVILDK